MLHESDRCRVDAEVIDTMRVEQIHRVEGSMTPAAVSAVEAVPRAAASGAARPQPAGLVLHDGQDDTAAPVSTS